MTSRRIVAFSHLLILCLALAGFLFIPIPVSAAGIEILEDGATIGDGVTLNLRAKSSAPITNVRVDVRFGRGPEPFTVRRIQVQPNTEIQVSYKDDGLQGNQIPSGALVTYQFTIQDSAGNQTQTEQRSVLYLNQQYQWTSIEEGLITIYSHSISQVRARMYLDTAQVALTRYKDEMGFTLEYPVSLVMFSSVQEMFASRRQSPGNAIGISFTGYYTVHVADYASPASTESTIIHEIAHQITHVAARTTLAEVPSWLNEGISVYFEPGGAASYQRYVNDAVAKDRLNPLRQLNRPPTKQEDVSLLYAEGSAVVTYLVKTYGAERMALLLSSMKSGKTIDGALIAAYGKNRDLVENEWRATVGAPLLEIIAEPTPLPATPVPAGRARLSDNTTYEFWYEPIVEPRWLLIGALVAGISGFFIIGIGAISWMVRR